MRWTDKASSLVRACPPAVSIMISTQELVWHMGHLPLLSGLLSARGMGVLEAWTMFEVKHTPLVALRRRHTGGVLWNMGHV